eukprot:scaffold443099_cov15-Prasinocladus_malaysianus.AAC.1
MLARLVQMAGYRWQSLDSRRLGDKPPPVWYDDGELESEARLLRKLEAELYDYSRTTYIARVDALMLALDQEGAAPPLR